MMLPPINSLFPLSILRDQTFTRKRTTRTKRESKTDETRRARTHSRALFWDARVNRERERPDVRGDRERKAHAPWRQNRGFFPNTQRSFIKVVCLICSNKAPRGKTKRETKDDGRTSLSLLVSSFLNTTCALSRGLRKEREWWGNLRSKSALQKQCSKP